MDLDKDVEKKLDEILTKATFLDLKDVPDIGLYMDQVLTLLEDKLTFLKSEDGEKALTKTMINNYSKNKLLPSPDKKKYKKNHIILLALIYYYKSLISIGEIKSLTGPLIEGYFEGDASITLSQIYETVCKHASKVAADTKSDVEKKIKEAKETFNELEEDEAKKLRLYSLISALSYDVFIKKHLIDELIETMDEEE